MGTSWKVMAAAAVVGGEWPVSLVPLQPLRATQGDHRPTEPSGPREAQVSSACFQDCQLLGRICFCPWAGGLHPASRIPGRGTMRLPQRLVQVRTGLSSKWPLGRRPCAATLCLCWILPPSLFPLLNPFPSQAAPAPFPAPQAASSQLPVSCPDLPCPRPGLTWDLEDPGRGPWGPALEPELCPCRRAGG